MNARSAFWSLTAAAVVMVAGETASAAIARFHFVPVDGTGQVQLVPAPSGAAADKVSVLGRAPYSCPPTPTCVVHLCHPYTNITLNIPLALPPDSTPQIMHRRDRVIYNYGSYTVTVHFLPDGSVDVLYNSGLLRSVEVRQP
jgi:hypothetical protein